MITQSRLKEVLLYNPDTGFFTWIKRTGNRAAGSLAGTPRANEYIQIRVDKKIYLAHRLAWLYVHGVFPPDQLDHINRIRTDNRISNLRLATQAENKQNFSKSRRNKSGIIGVSWCKQSRKWHARICINGRKTDLGRYDSIEKAAAARAEAKARYHTFNPEDAE